MRKMIASVVIVAVLGMAPVSHSQEPAPAPAPPATQPTVAELQRQIEKLKFQKEIAKMDSEKENNQLRAENQRLKAEIERLSRRVTVVPRLPTIPGATTRPYTFVHPEPRNVPNDWVPQQFNGQTFYVIPLAGESRPTQAPASRR